MILKLAFRNLLRNPTRSGLVILMIAVCIAMLMSTSGLYDGMAEQMIRDTIYADSGQITLFQKGYRLNKRVSISIKNPDPMLKALKTIPEIEHMVPRIIQEGMVANAHLSRGIQLMGIQIETEKNATSLASKMKQGHFTFGPQEKGLIIGEELAKKLGAKVNQKLVITSQTSEKDLLSLAGQITGIFRSHHPGMDGTVVLMDLNRFQTHFKFPNQITQISLFTQKQIPISDIEKKIPESVEAVHWSTQHSALKWMQDMLNNYNIISYFIVFIIVAIAIFNVILITTLERVREFGIMMAIGTRFHQIARIILFESLLLGGMGYVLGITMGALIILHFNHHGLDLSTFSAGLESFGMASIMIPILKPAYFLWAFLAVLIMSLLAIIWPIWVLYKLNPVRSIQFS